VHGTRLAWRVRVLLVLALGLGLLGVAAQPAQPAVKCAGAPPDYPHMRYPERRVFLESQAWWTKGTPDAETSGEAHHVHLGLCFPQGRVARFRAGKIRWDFRILFHHMQGYRATQLRGGWFDRGLGRTCRHEHCQWYVTAYGSTRYPTFPQTRGRKELRPKVRIKTPDGFEMFQSAGWQLILRRGRRIVNDRPTNAAIGRGWYTKFGYANVGMRNYTAPGLRVSGTWWTPRVTATPGASGSAVTSHLFTVDPDFHMQPADRGTVIRQGRGTFEGRLRIDTTKLSNGLHKLVMIAHARHINGRAPDGTNSGIEVLPFWVRN
jgi:hypothetical protein